MPSASAPEVRKLIEACGRAKRDDITTLLTFAGLFEEQRAYALADGILRSLGPSAPEVRQKLLAVYQKRIEAAAGRQGDLTELSRDYQTLQSTYTNLLAKKEDSKVAANLERRQIGEQFKILDPARLPERPTSPNRPQLQSMGLMAGIGVGVLLMGLIEYLDKTLKSEGDVTAALNLLVLATVPILPEVGYRVARRRKIIAIVSVLELVLLLADVLVLLDSGAVVEVSVLVVLL